MNDLERFKAIVHGQEPDYVPIFGFPGAPGVSGGCMRKTHERLVATGMPDWVDGDIALGSPRTTEKWQRYWGTTGPIGIDFFPGEPAGGLEYRTRIEGDREIIECETGALTRQVIDNDVTYSMPEFVSFHVRDRASWEFYKERTTPGAPWSTGRIDEAARKFDDRDKPLVIGFGSTFGALRGLMGPEGALTALYDDPELVHDIMDHLAWSNRTYVFPVIERLKPEVVMAGEDLCYNHGMLLSPEHFRRFCAPIYSEASDVARSCGADLVAIDTDGNAMEFVSVATECGVTGMFPFEVKAGNDLFVLRERHPDFVMFGWLEKEVLNEGNTDMIAPEIMSKVPALLEKGRYFPNADHGIQPLATFENMCKFLTLLHEVTNNPEGEFPRC